MRAYNCCGVIGDSLDGSLKWVSVVLGERTPVPKWKAFPADGPAVYFTTNDPPTEKVLGCSYIAHSLIKLGNGVRGEGGLKRNQCR